MNLLRQACEQLLKFCAEPDGDDDDAALASHLAAIEFALKDDVTEIQFKVAGASLTREILKYETAEMARINACEQCDSAEARIQSLEASLAEAQRQLEHYKESYRELCVESVAHETKVAALTEVLKQAQEVMLAYAQEPCAHVCRHFACRVHREISKALGE